MQPLSVLNSNRIRRDGEVRKSNGGRFNGDRKPTGTQLAKPLCFRCGDEGHKSQECKNEQRENVEQPPLRSDGAMEGWRYAPPELPDGDQIFKERSSQYEGIGRNFANYKNLPTKVLGSQQLPPASSFKSMGLDALILKNLAKCGFNEVTPVQKYASPQLMAGLNVLCYAPTGSGKTAAFLLPLINQLLRDKDLSPPATAPASPEILILAPTRELAVQLAKEANMFSTGSAIKIRTIYGGTSIHAQKQQLLLGCNILAATPGRLLQCLKDEVIELKRVRGFILDEADRMLDMGFIPDVDSIIKRLSPEENRQSAMFFSARMPNDIRDVLAKKYLKSYVNVEIGHEGEASLDVRQEFWEVKEEDKKHKILDLLNVEDKNNRILIFCGTRRKADFLAYFICDSGIPATSIHGDRFQNQREIALQDFINRKFKVLVASDVAARGLDIPNVEVVVNYDLPFDSAVYVLRIGRAGRVGHIGRSVTFFNPELDVSFVKSLLANSFLTESPLPDFFKNLKINAGAEGLSEKPKAAKENVDPEDSESDWDD